MANSAIAPGVKASKPGVKASRLQHLRQSKPSLVGRVGRGFGWGFLFLLLCACSRSPQPQLSEADALMEAHPDSALALLQAVDTAALAPDDRPYFALLLTQAQVKTGAPIASDSLISAALNAYRFSPNPDLRKRAHFYAAQLAYDAGDNQKAMKNILIAYELAKAKDDYYWMAKSSEIIADIYSEIYNFPEEEKYILETIDNYGRAGKILNQRYAYCDLALNSFNQGQIGRSIEIIDSIRTLVAQESPFNEGLDDYALYVLIAATLQSGNINEVEQLLSRRDNDSSATLLERLSAAKKMSYVEACNGDSAASTELISEAYSLATSDKELVKVLYTSYLNKLNLGDYRSAAFLADSIIELQSRIVRNVLFDAVSSIPTDFYSEQAVAQKKRSQLYELYFWSASIVAAIILAMSVLLYRWRMRAKHAEYESALANTMATLLQLESQAIEAQNNVEKLVREKSQTISLLCDEYFELGKTEKAHKRIIAQVDSELNKLRSPETIAELEKTNDNYIGGIISAARSQCYFLSQSELQLVSLLLNKYTVRTICFVLNITYNNFYQKKSRIVKKIEASAIPIKEELLRRLNARNER